MASSGTEAATFAAFYRHHEHALIRHLQRTVRSPAVTAELAAETFALALREAPAFDPARETPAAWLFALADRVLLRRARTGRVDDGARRALGVDVRFDDRALRRIDALRGEGRAPWRVDTDQREAPLVLPGLERALVAAARRRESARRRRRHAGIGVRVAAAVVSITVVLGGAILPDRQPARASNSVWLPYAAPGVEGRLPNTWFLSSGREPLFTTFNAGDDVCRALATMGPRDALVFVGVTRCAPADTTRVKGALIVVGPHTPAATREQAREIVRRMRRL